MKDNYSGWLHKNARKSPCYGCEFRHPKCHSECEIYKDYYNERIKELDSVKRSVPTAFTQKADKNRKNKIYGDY